MEEEIPIASLAALSASVSGLHNIFFAQDYYPIHQVASPNSHVMLHKTRAM
jgi:hypothetical protein